MDKLVTISNVKENVLEFDVEVEGVDTTDMAVRFIIEASGMELGFDSKKGKKTKWSVDIPALAILEKTTYPFHIDIIVDGYYFEPLRGSVNVVGSHEIYTSTPENITLSPAKPKLEDIIKSTKSEENPPKEEDVKTPKVPLVKPNRKFKMQPIKVKDGKELFKTLTNVPKVERKTDNKLDDQILNLLKTAKDSKNIDIAVEKKEEPKKKADDKLKKDAAVLNILKNTKPAEKKEDAGTKIVDKKSDEIKKSKEEPNKNESPKKVDEKDDDEKKSEKRAAAKSVAEKIIHSVTGLGGRDNDVMLHEKSNDDKIKNIIKEEAGISKKDEPYKKTEVREASAIKKITKDKKFISVDESREQRIKNILNENKIVDESKTTTTITELKKKDSTSD